MEVMESLQSHEGLHDQASGQGLRSDSSKECPKGCGLLILTNDDREHSCISELRTSIEVLRAEMTCMMEDQRREMQAIFDVQRGHMIEKETALQDQIKALKTELGELGKRLQVLLDVETCRKQELERMTSERTEIMTFLSDLQKEKQDVGSLCQNCLAGAKGKVTNV